VYATASLYYWSHHYKLKNNSCQYFQRGFTFCLCVTRACLCSSSLDAWLIRVVNISCLVWPRERCDTFVWNIYLLITLDHLSLLLSLSSFELKLICIYVAFPVSVFIHSKSPSPYSHLISYGLAHLSGLSTPYIFQIVLKLYIRAGCNKTSGEVITSSSFWRNGTGDKVVMCCFWLAALWVSSTSPSRHTIPSFQ
jgi:hypothetical protein